MTGRKEKVLCMCNYGVNRSPTVNWVFSEIVKERGLDYTSNCASLLGIHVYPISQVKRRISSYSIIIVMEKEMINKVRRKYDYGGKIISLDIEDIYSRDERELVEIARKRLNERFFDNL